MKTVAVKLFEGASIGPIEDEVNEFLEKLAIVNRDVCSVEFHPGDSDICATAMVVYKKELEI